MALQEELERQGNFLFRYRGSIPVCLLLFALAYYSYREFQGYGSYDSPWKDFYQLFCLCVSFLGLVVRIITVGHTPVNTSGRNIEKQEADVLNTTGIYSVVRHPLYLGNFFMWLGLSLLTRGFWFNICFALFYWLYYERIMFAEEQFLRTKFGDSYLNWSKNVPPFFPRMKDWVSSELPLSWKKVLKKEKNGFFAVLLVIFIFDYTGNCINLRSFQFSINIWFYGAVFGLLVYLVLRFIKYNTNWLHEEGR